MPRNFNNFPGLPSRADLLNPFPRRVFLKRNLPWEAVSRRVDSGRFNQGLNGVDIDLYGAVQNAMSEGWIQVPGQMLSLNGDQLSISSGNSITLPSLSGEANTASNAGAGQGVFAQKTGIDLSFKSLVAGSNITLNSTSDSITISGTGSGSSTYLGLTDTPASYTNNAVLVSTTAGVVHRSRFLVDPDGSVSGIDALPAGSGVDSASFVSGGATIIGREMFTRGRSTITLTNTNQVNLTLTQSSVAGFSPSRVMWSVSVYQGSTRIIYTISSNNTSALVTFTPANTDNLTVDILAQSNV